MTLRALYPIFLTEKALNQTLSVLNNHLRGFLKVIFPTGWQFFPFFPLETTETLKGTLSHFTHQTMWRAAYPVLSPIGALLGGEFKLDWVLTEAGPLSPHPNLIATLGMVLMPQRTISLIQPLLSVIQTEQHGGREWKS